MSGNPTEYGVIGALLVIVSMFLLFLKVKGEQDAKERESERVDRAAARQEFEETIRGIAESHSESSKSFTDGLKEHTKALHDVCLRLEHCPDRRNGKGRKKATEGG